MAAGQHAGNDIGRDINAHERTIMKDWDTGERTSRWLWLEVAIAGTLVGIGYLGTILLLWEAIIGWLA